MMFEKYDAYKDSGVEWIGEIPNHWEVKKLKYIGSSIIGLTYSPNDLCSVEEGTLVARSSNIFEGKFVLDKSDNVYVKSKVPSKLFLKADDILICSRNGSRDLIGKCAYIKDDSNYSFGAFTTVFRGHFNHYLFYILNSDIFKRLSGTFLTSTINQLTISNLNSISIPLPPEREIDSIKKFLHEKLFTIDEAIAIKEQQIALLNERKQIVIQKAVTQGLDPSVPMKDSGVEWIGQIPEHWNVVRAKYLFKEVEERSVFGNEELLSVSHLTGVTPRSEKNVSMFMAEDYSGSKVCKRHDLVMNIMWAWMGALGVSDYDGIVSPSYGVYRQKIDNTFNPEYLEYLLKTTKYLEHYNRVSTGLHSSRLRFYGHMFFNMKLGFPNLDEQNEIIASIKSQISKIELAVENLANQIEKLKEYKTTLINDAVTGKIKVA
ncbi:restriction endonuclease subunit S [Acinetobacter towneri]|uniref:restriction endonuclease subunit S n=2 Tax=Acinetobacter TaxID=469 RepID=UPI0015B69F59|nr:restriction endonuclease subunit S [Acinetobacter towneri]NWJ92995.1 restriction endonuclease subunit S [Acinetobacter sp. Swhac1]UIP24219.1 restriction endonuclease subunit S [Acinetobacter towneri]